MAKKEMTSEMKARMARWSDDENPYRQFLSRLADRWTIMVFIVLKGAPRNRARFSELKNSIEGISQRMLTATLRNLEREGLVERHVYAEVPPRVEYELTDKGRSMRAPIKAVMDWVDENWPGARRFNVKHGRAK